MLINGKTIDLKVIDESDIEQVRKWRNMKDVSDYMLTRTFISKDQQKKWYKSINEDPSCIYWIILSKEGIKLGLVSLTKIDLTNSNAEPGLYIGEKKYRTFLYGMEAYYYILDYGFTHLGLEKVYGTVLSTNIVALKMNASFGYIKEEAVKDGLVIDGVFYDVFKLGLYKNDFYQSKMTKFFRENNHVH
jgi:UDP-4-amino-4,6-dideoxy-N-acetyl-beta-L-altrosamine N-acetyltransferase